MAVVPSSPVSRPLVSIVTPCLNSGRFLRRTIESVLAQDYPDIEYIVMDGGSTDETLGILREYSGRIRFHSGPDSGTADAINKGFALCRGSIFTFINADDTLRPDAVSRVVQEFDRHPEAGVVYGNGNWIDENDRVLGMYPARPFDPGLLASECFICQPAAFVRSAAFRRAGGMNASLQFTFDYDLWIRVARHGTMRFVPDVLACSRMHRDNKTVGQRGRVLRENLHLLRSHYGYVPFGWIYGYTGWLLDGRDQFFDELRPSLTKYAFSLFVGLMWNWRRPLRFLTEWARVMSWSGLLRRWAALRERHEAGAR